MNEVSQRKAKMVLRSLGTSGQPPKLGATIINVGTDRFLEHLRQEFLEDHCQPYEGMDGGGACKWIEADYGNGKTQFLRCVQELAWQRDYLTAYVELSQDECPLDRTDRVYGAVARAIQAEPREPGDVDRTKGIDATLRLLLDRRFEPETIRTDFQARLASRVAARPVRPRGDAEAVGLQGLHEASRPS